MCVTRQSQRRENATAELARHAPQVRPVPLIDRLSFGLVQLRDLFVERIHTDVEQEFGLDSMIAPLSPATEVKQVLRAAQEIDVYSSIVACDEVERGGYVNQPQEWFLDWLVNLCLINYDEAEVAKRLDSYQRLSIDDCRRRFVMNLQRAVPESLRTPLVLFRLVPYAIRIVVATAFGDAARAQQLRRDQQEILPAIRDCHECHGGILANEDHCRCCGNPVWTFAWLRDD